MRWPTWLIALGMVGVGAMGTSEGQIREKTTVAVHFEAGAGLEDVAARIADELTAGLVQHLKLVTRDDMDKLLAEHRLGFSDAMKSVANFGEMLGAQKIILGRVDSVASSEAVRIRVRIVDVEQASLDLQEVVDIVPRERLGEATGLLAGLVVAKVPLRGRIMRIQKDRMRINLGSRDNLRKGMELEVLRESEYGWITAGRLKVVSVSAYSSETEVVRQEESFEKGQYVETVVDVGRVKALRNKLAGVGQKERQRLAQMAEEKKRADEARSRAERAKEEEERKLEEMRRKRKRAEEERKLPKSWLRFGVGYFEPADSDFKDIYYEGKSLDLDDGPSFYSMTVYLLSHPYFRGYIKGTYFDRKGPEPTHGWDEQERRKIFRTNLGGCLRIPIAISWVCVVPYVGGGGELAYMVEDSGTGERKGHGMGHEFFFGGALVYRRAIGVFIERIEEVVSVGEDEVDVGGTSVMVGMEIWW